MNLKEYQQEALEVVVKQLEEGVSRQLVVLPTGTGKTILFAAIISLLNLKTLVIAHREELIQQAADKILAYAPGSDIGICKAGKNELDHQIVIGSVQTCSQPNRLQQLKKEEFRVLVIDEAHHAPAKSYRSVIEGLGFMDDPKKLLLGLTATPQRNDSLELGDVFEKIVFERSISEMINNDPPHLSPVIGRRISTDVSLKGVKSCGGDFVAKDLARAINIPERNDLIASKYKQHASNRKGVAFCVNVQHCHDLAAALNSVGISAKAVWGEMDLKERVDVLDEFTRNEVQVLTSCGVLTEGYDEETIDCIVMARSTKSKSLYIQCVGRGLRLSEEKENCLVLDFTDSCHNLKSLITLNSTIPEAEVIKEEREEKLNAQNVKTTPVDTKVIEISDSEFDILGRRGRFIWIPLYFNAYSLMDDNKNEMIVKAQDGGFVADFYTKRNEHRQLVSTPSSLEYCFDFCEKIAIKHLSMCYGDLHGAWLRNAQNQPATPSQKEFLLKHKAFASWMNKADASTEIRRIIALNNQRRRLFSRYEPITEKQKHFLERANINTDNMSKLQATQMISQIVEYNYGSPR